MNIPGPLDPTPLTQDQQDEIDSTLIGIINAINRAPEGHITLNTAYHNQRVIQEVISKMKESGWLCFEYKSSHQGAFWDIGWKGQKNGCLKC